MRLECAGGSLVFADTSTTLFRGMIVLIDKSLNMNPSPEEQEPLVESDCEPIGNENGLSSVMSALIVLKGESPIISRSVHYWISDYSSVNRSGWVHS